jgi:thiol:disulfide interchange protein DsbG
MSSSCSFFGRLAPSLLPEITLKPWLILLVLLFATSACAKDYPAPIQALASKGITIKGQLKAPDGIRGYVGDYHGRSMPIYLLPDGKHVVIGTLFDDAGNDLTQAPLQAATTPVLDASTWTELGKASWIAEGATKPKRIVYVVTDTECPYCHKLWVATQPLLAGGDVQVRHIVVAVISPNSLGRAAAIFDAKDPQAAMHRHEVNFGHSPIQPESPVTPATAKRIEANNALMQRLGVSGTPATFYKDAEGKIRQIDGMMPSEQIKVVFGS